MEKLLVVSDDFMFEIEIIILTFIVSFIGSFTHEYLFGTSSNRHILKNLNIYISTIISTIICYIIDPWILDFNVRLILLPPLLFGLMGMDLVKRLATIKGSTGLIEYILSFLGIRRTNTNNTNYGIPSENNNTEPEKKNENIDSEMKYMVVLDNMTQIIYNAISTVLIEYYTRHDKEAFLHSYARIKTEQAILRSSMTLYKSLPVDTSLKLSELLKKSMELDTIYNDIIGSSTSN